MRSEMEKITEEKFIFTPENLLENFDKLGAWSAYHLATIALLHYFPHEYDEDDHCELKRECELLKELGCEYWQDAVKKYHAEIGYKHLSPDCVNEY